MLFSAHHARVRRPGRVPADEPAVQGVAQIGSPWSTGSSPGSASSSPGWSSVCSRSCAGAASTSASSTRASRSAPPCRRCSASCSGPRRRCAPCSSGSSSIPTQTTRPVSARRPPWRKLQVVEHAGGHDAGAPASAGSVEDEDVVQAELEVMRRSRAESRRDWNSGMRSSGLKPKCSSCCMPSMTRDRDEDVEHRIDRRRRNRDDHPSVRRVAGPGTPRRRASLLGHRDVLERRQHRDRRRTSRRRPEDRRGIGPGAGDTGLGPQLAVRARLSMPDAGAEAETDRPEQRAVVTADIEDPRRRRGSGGPPGRAGRSRKKRSTYFTPRPARSPNVSPTRGTDEEHTVVASAATAAGDAPVDSSGKRLVRRPARTAAPRRASGAGGRPAPRRAAGGADRIFFALLVLAQACPGPTRSSITSGRLAPMGPTGRSGGPTTWARTSTSFDECVLVGTGLGRPDLNPLERAARMPRIGNCATGQR